MFRRYHAKRQKTETENKQSFMRRMNEKMASRNVERDLYKSQKVCEQLDSQLVRSSLHLANTFPIKVYQNGQLPIVL